MNPLSRLARLARNTVTAWRDTRRWRRAQRAFTRLRQRGAPLVLDLGSGGPGRPGAVGIDLAPGADIVLDLRCGLPLPDASVAAIFSDHFLEHLRLAEVAALLRECHRVLQPGGRLRFSVPHIDPFLGAYQGRNVEFFRERITDIPTEHAHLFLTVFDFLSWLLLRDGEHRCMFDSESIVAHVRQAGFSRVHPAQYDPLIDGKWRFSSVYIEAWK